MKDNIVKSKSYLFAVRVINLYKYLVETHKEFVLSKQILRCGTSIGANVAEATDAQSHADFIHKMSIALKEARETEYWLSLLTDTEYIDKKQHDSLNIDCTELLKLLTTIIKSAKHK
ncbi:MAG: four helix bundle protein [Bacteroidetes bacterium]|nr:MAG: four helix bundle protein [Bacteroidota bacterium]